MADGIWLRASKGCGKGRAIAFLYEAIAGIDFAALAGRFADMAQLGGAIRVFSGILDVRVYAIDFIGH